MLLPLTAELLRARTVVLFQHAFEAAGPVEEIIFEIVTCDGCGRVVNLLEGHPDGWTTEGDVDTGWRDLCETCSPVFVCPRCGKVSHNPGDREHGYCGRCHDFTAVGR